jgi:hypothetical protein
MTEQPRSRGRVFRRSLVADPPVAVESNGATIRDSTGARTSMPPAARSSSTSGTGAHRSRT